TLGKRDLRTGFQHEDATADATQISIGRVAHVDAVGARLLGDSGTRQQHEQEWQPATNTTFVRNGTSKRARKNMVGFVGAVLAGDVTEVPLQFAVANTDKYAN